MRPCTLSSLRRGSRLHRLALALALGLAGGCAASPPTKPTPLVKGPRSMGAHARGASSRPSPVVRRRPPKLDVQVTVRKGQLEVDYRLPLAWLPFSPKTLALRFFSYPEFEKGTKRYVDFVRLLDAKGHESPFPEHFELPGTHLSAGVFHVRYRVALTHHQAHPRHGRDDAPHPTARGWHLLGRAFLPQQILLDGKKRLSLRGRLAFSLPPGWRMTSTYDRADTRFDGVIGKMVHAVYHVGDFARREVRRGKTVVELVSGDFSAVELAPLDQLVTAVLAEGESLLGKLGGAGRLLVVVDRDAEGFQGGVIGGTVTLTSAVPPFAQAMAPTGVILTHELMHLWNRADRFWLNEGMARYLEVLLKLRVDGAEPGPALAELLALYQGYRRRFKAGQTIETARDGLAYDGGAIALFCADAELRAEKAGTLLDVHRAARLATRKVRQHAAPGWLQTKIFLAELSRRSAAVAKRLQQRLAATDVFDLAPCLRAAGYLPQPLRYRGFSKEALLGQVLRVLRITAFGLRVLEVGPKSRLQVGDVLLAIDGRPVTRLHELERLFARARGRLRLRVQRAGQLKTLRLPLPRLPQRARPLRRELGARRTALAKTRSPLEAPPRIAGGL